MSKSASLTVTAACALAFLVAAPAAAWDEPVWVDDHLVYPEGAQIPAGLTETELRYLEKYPLQAEPGRGEPPSGPVHCVAEYEPMEGLLLAWEGFTTILRQIALNVTTTGNADIYMVVDSVSEQNSASSTLSSYGVPMDRVHFVVRTTDTVWIRDYGPRYVYQGDCRAIVDHTYNRPRPNDNAFNSYFAAYKNHERYLLPMVHGGGNYHLNALDQGNATRLICNENPGLTEQQIIDYWLAYQNVYTTLWTPFPQSVDWTQHIDMWMQIVADDVIVISDWPHNPGSTQDQICDGAAADFAAWGWTVCRTPARLYYGTHYTYTNMILCNDVALIPYYSRYPQHSSEALTAYRSALPEKTVLQINCDDIIGSAGALHCICMHVPAPVGGASPTVYLKNLRGGEVLEPGTSVTINWISDDDVEVTGVDILLSRDSGETFPIEIVAGTADDGSYNWTVPDIYAPHARLRLVAHDADDNSGLDESDSDLFINGTNNCPGDLNGDGVIDLDDLTQLLASYGLCDGDPGYDPAADLDNDDCVGLDDLALLLSAYGTSCP
jgi:agmatine/peptidylarginine deiminase